MRFEIKTGGAIVILVGLAGLSLIVFALGLFAGYDMARNTGPEAPQAASVYPLPNPPPAPNLAKAASKSSDEIASTQSVAAKAAGKTKASAGADSGASSLSMDKNAGPVAAPPPRTVANTAASVSPPKIAPSETATEEKSRATKPAATNPPERYASATDSSGVRHKPFNIQIDAVMDRANAEQMTARLQKLGYHASMVPTDISGQTWWRVRVGPYQSQEEASAAEQELRTKYKNAYAP
jgi:cell division septation protein DedD